MGLAGRLLSMGASNGPRNMAADEALARLCRDHATLRFYEWDAPTLSIGYFQRTGEIDLVACRELAIGLVRRPTGGRAVLHRHDLTYSLILPLHSPWTEFSIAESYHRINACLRRGLESLGVSASTAISDVGAAREPSPFCFSAITQQELLVGGKKVIGSAQRRFPAALLLQGVVLLDFISADLLALLREEERANTAESLGLIGSLREALGWLPDRVAVRRAIKEGFARELGVEFEEGTLDPHEVELADQLAAHRYASDDWTLRR